MATDQPLHRRDHRGAASHEMKGDVIARKHRRYGNLVFDRDAIVRAALRAYFESIFGEGPLTRVSFAACAEPRWTGDLQRGAFYNGDGCGAYHVVGWTEAGVVALAFELGWGPLEGRTPR